MHLEPVRQLGRSRKLGATELGRVVGCLEDSGVHVTIVCVAQYEFLDLNKPYLAGAVASADRLVAFWQSGQLPRGQRLASVSLFMSAPPHRPSEYQDQASPATLDLIEKHFESLRSLSTSEDSLVIHWIGHGQCFGEEGGLVRGVHTSDTVYFNGKTHCNGIDVGALFAAFGSQFSSNVLITVDACAASEADGRGVFTNPLGAHYRPGRPTHVLGLFAAAPNSTTTCVGVGHQIEDGLFGGSLFSEAVRLALDGFGATKDPGDVAVVYPKGLRDAAEYHHRRLQRGYTVRSLSPDAKGDVERNRRRITEPRLPRSVVQLFARSGTSAETVACSCSVKGEAIGPDPLAASWSDHDDCWELSLPQTDGRDSGYCGRLSRGDLLGPDQEFGAVEPITTVFLGTPQ